MSVKQRKQDADRKQRERERAKNAGLVQVTVYVPETRKSELREMARTWCAENVRDQDSV